MPKHPFDARNIQQTEITVNKNKNIFYYMLLVSREQADANANTDPFARQSEEKAVALIHHLN